VSNLDRQFPALSKAFKSLSSKKRWYGYHWNRISRHAFDNPRCGINVIDAANDQAIKSDHLIVQTGYIGLSAV
jgi:hypothetical protein